MTKTRTFVSYQAKTQTAKQGANVSTRRGYTQLTRTRTGSSVPSWARKIKMRQSASSDMVAYEAKCDNITSATYISPEPVPGNSYYGVELSYTGDFRYDRFIEPKANLIPECRSYASAKAYKTISSGFNGLTVLGELRSTIGMIKNPAVGLRRAVALLKTDHAKLRDKFKKARDYKNAVADSWLEAQFGWAPLFSDIQSGFDAYNKAANKLYGKSFKATYRLTENVPISRVEDIPVSSLIYQAVYVSAVCETSVTYGGFAKIKASTPPANCIYGFGLPSFVPAAWELLPWSFLIDYFGNIGQILDSWATAQYTDFAYGYSTVRTLATTSVTSAGGVVDLAPPFTRRLSVNEPGGATWTTKQITRTNSAGIPLPSLQVRQKLGSSQMLNMAALFLGQRSDAVFRK